MRAIYPDLLVRLNATAAELSYAGAIGGIGGCFVPFIAAVFDKYRTNGTKVCHSILFTQHLFYRLVGHEELITGLCCLVGAFTLSLRPITLNVWVFTIYSFLDTSFYYGGLFSGN